LTQNQTLLKENKLHLQLRKPIKYKGVLESNILSLATPKPNTHLLDLGLLPKYKLWKYNNQFAHFQTDTLNSKLLKHKVEKPQLIDTLLVQKSTLNIKQFMLNQGYYNTSVSCKITPSKNPQSSTVDYHVQAGKTFTIRKVIVDTPDLHIHLLITDNPEKSLLVIGKVFTNYNSSLERDRLYKIIRNQGYFDFKADNISFEIDTSNTTSLRNLLTDPFEQATNFVADTKKENDSVNVYVRVAQTKDSTYLTPYTIQDVIVTLIDGSVMPDSTLAIISNELNRIQFRYTTLPVNRKIIANSIFIRPGDLFNMDDLEATINRLNQLSLFQFVNIKYEKVNGVTGKLNCLIQLSTSPKMDMEIQSDVSTSDGYYDLGIGAGLTYRNRNLFHGANLLSLRGAYSTEFRNDKLLTGTKSFYLSGHNINVNTSITFPKFIVPFRNSIFSNKNLPFTILSLTYSNIQRVQNYTIINISGSFGYSWRETIYKNWRFNPGFLTVTKVPDHLMGDAFKEKRKTNSYLQKTFSDNTILGESTTFEYQSPLKHMYGDFKTLKIGLEEAGTLLKGINSIYHSVTQNNIEPIANYLKLDIDFRKYTNRAKHQFANRCMFGFGLPLGDNTTLPYIKQFSAGGAFSNRGFRARSLGPGRSVDSSYSTGVGIIDRTGDLKFEANTEYRFDLLKLFSGAINLKGAWFADAGNIWLLNKSADIVGGEFDPTYFLHDIAISSGLGLRLDFSFFVFRVDLGYPIKQPQVVNNFGFAFDKLRINSGSWNIALGYPF